MATLRSCLEYCPYCGEAIELLIDDSEPEQDYIEDCQVCCQPICVQLRLEDDGDVRLWLRTESE